MGYAAESAELYQQIWIREETDDGQSIWTI